MGNFDLRNVRHHSIYGLKFITTNISDQMWQGSEIPQNRPKKHFLARAKPIYNARKLIIWIHIWKDLAMAHQKTYLHVLLRILKSILLSHVASVASHFHRFGRIISNPGGALKWVKFRSNCSNFCIFGISSIWPICWALVWVSSIIKTRNNQTRKKVKNHGF